MPRNNAGTTNGNGKLAVRRKEGQIYSHVRSKWLVETPEERVRQGYLCTLVNEYGYALNQISEEERVTGRGSANARSDFVIWRTAQERQDGKTPLIVVECKADNVTIDQKTYAQGANYAQYERAKFFVTHNNRETKYWQVDLEKRAPNFSEIENIPKATDSDDEIKKLLARLKVFKEDEFAALLHQCHNVIRNREKKDPAAAFDEIAKILFLKVSSERRMRAGRGSRNLFTAEFLDAQKEVFDDPVNALFQETKTYYKADRIFDPNEGINLKFNTAREIVALLELYNLSDTSEDIKGIAFERFLGRTFRGEIGQFFTPRTIVEFMIRMVDPKEGHVICDPASGSGGFLIRFFEIVREQILADIDRQYRQYKEEIEAQQLPEEEQAQLLRDKFDELQKSVKQDRKGSRLWNLANKCIYGTDANERMARTSKMNMIMHGDGHGGVHHRDGFLNVNGIFEGRFDIILTNPPFGANVESTDIVTPSDVETDEEINARYAAQYGSAYREAQARIKAVAESKQNSILSLFTLPKIAASKIKTEILFIERCLSLLKPGGQLGIVLPEGIFNNPSLAYVREFAEDRAFIRAVVSLPQETFYSSGASVKASLLFMQKFTEEEQGDYNARKAQAEAEIRGKYQDEIDRLTEIMQRPNLKPADFLKEIEKPTKEQKAKAKQRAKDANAELKAQKEEAKKGLKALEEVIKTEARALLKERFPYPIFLYEAEKVGLTATGEEDANELCRYPKDNVPAGIEKTCLELYQEFRQAPERFLLAEVGQ